MTTALEQSAKPLQGVNLGGWLVLEKWMTSSLFEGTNAVDELSYCRGADAERRRRLKDFRDTFITESDFPWLKAQGINSVRLPVGYWAFGGQAPFLPTSQYMDQAFTWAEKYGLSVLLDVHAAKGSQNGQDHSGAQGAVEWAQPEYIADTVNFVQKLAERYGASPALLGIELLNEPGRHLPKDLLIDYYKQCYKVIRSICGEDTWILFSDSYFPRHWRKQLPAAKFPNLLVDTHYYQTFSWLDKRLPFALNLWRTHHELPCKLHRLRSTQPVVVGEWSLTMSNAGKRPDQAHQADRTRQFAAAQLRAFQQTQAWYFWNYKTEAQDTWNFRNCIEQGWLQLG